MSKYRVLLYVEDKMTEDFGIFYHEDKAEKEAIKVSRKYKGPTAKVKVWEMFDNSELFPENKVILTYCMGRKVKN